ncbi:hypothetical protein PIB30_091545 [Stylosanthes scabra]|uniref:mannosyl-glycoprotein endo-beta-N-acetylglucosaminidase n=1 Tax=Stylosanthes scabra TaxID=79078 RepID=A0ABU6VWM8_9FABA|nr:hypothetical protein [Stylosanthes scabra]
MSEESPPSFDPKQASVPISYPLKTLKELQSRSYLDSFHYPFNKASVPIIQTPTSSNRGKILVCHDMQGGYLDDKYVQGGTNSDAYSLWHWYLIDSFVYFSHNLVTLPPVTWTNTAHRHAVKVLGTFLTEGEEGSDVCNELLSTKESAQMYAQRLAELASHLGFDGWLLNMEVSLESDQIPNLKEFVKDLTLTMHSSVPGSLVIWYDSVTDNGSLDYQNQLNQYNKPFFDICDGIFANYFWQENYPKLSADVAGDRKYDVYMGIDVFGRGTFGGGQWNTNVALDVIKKADVSAAIFAPGWVYETKQKTNFETAQNRWWGLVEKSWGLVRKYPVTLPFYSNFDQGRGNHITVDGINISNASWCNLSSQGLQPQLEYDDSTVNSIQVLVDLKENSYSGGANITFHGTLQANSHFQKTIFQADLLLTKSPLRVTYSVKSDSNSLLGLVLHVTSTMNENVSILAAPQGMNHLSQKFGKIVPTTEKNGSSPGWITHEFTIDMNGYTLTEIRAMCYRQDHKLTLNSRPLGRDLTADNYSAILGHVTVTTLDYKPSFPLSNSWLVSGEYITLKSSPKGDSKFLSVKISWKLKEEKDESAFSHYNVYVENVSKVKEYIGVAHVNSFYVSELEVPSGTSSFKFIIQVCNVDGTNQKLDESPNFQLEV